MKSTRRLLLLLFVMAGVGCDSKAAKQEAAHEKPAKVEKLPSETELAMVTLSEDAARRLGIQTQEVLQRSVAPRRTLGGEAMVPVGRSIVVSAPVSAIVGRPQSQSIPAPGTHVALGEVVLQLTPLLSPERDVLTPAEQVQLVGARANLMSAQAVAQGDVERSRAEVEGARIALERAQKLFQDRAGARRAVDDAIAQLNISQSVLEAATQREQQLEKLIQLLQVQSSSGEASELPLSTPIGGILNRLSVREGQTVSAGSMLFEVVNLDTIWVRVPVFVDLLSTIQLDRSARLVSLSGESLQPAGTESPGAESPGVGTEVEARPIAAPPTADALSSSVDLYYEVDNRALGLRPGQRIGVELPLRGASQALVVPSASILFDIYGGAWVYVVTGERSYTRQRVSIRWTEAGQAMLAAGPAIGSQVVVEGAAELFGTEFGTGK